MKIKKLTATALILALCSSMLLTSCGGKSKGAGKGKEIEEMLEDTYGGRFTLTDTVAYRPGIYFIQSPVVSHYEYTYKWDQYKGEEIWVTTKDGGYQTNINYVLYRPELEEYFTTELEKKFPGGVYAPFLCVAWGHGETELEELDFDDAMDEWELNYYCVLAVDDVDDHKTIEKAIEEVFGDYNYCKLRFLCAVQNTLLPIIAPFKRFLIIENAYSQLGERLIQFLYQILFILIGMGNKHIVFR